MNVNRCVNCMEELESYPCPHCGFDPVRSLQPGYALPRDTILHGKFLVGRMLGQGGFGITYVGWDLSLDVKVAIKEFYPAGQVSRQSTLSHDLVWNDTEQSEAARHAGMESFLKEARKMARVDRIPEVVRVRETFHENGTAYIIMDFVEGETLKARLEREGPLPFDKAMEIFRPALAAMEQVHKAGLIHRDLSPDNIMLNPDGGVRILDLGAAKDLAVNRGASSMLVTKGGFSPLEQYGQRGGSGPWTDVYAMGATIYYTLTGVLPPNAVDRLDEDELRWDLPSLQSLPAPALEALRSALDIIASRRTQSMSELLAGLEAAAPEPDPGPVPERVPQPAPAPQLRPESQPESRPKVRSRKPAIISSVCACIGVILAVVLIISRQGDGGNAPTPSPSQSLSASPSSSPTPEPLPEGIVASGEAGEDVTWTMDDEGVLTVSGSGKMYDYSEMNPPWEMRRYDITSVIVEPGVTDVGNYAFYHCTQLTGVTLSEGLTRIGSSAFKDCTQLTSITIPEGLTLIGSSAFWNCSSLTNLTIPESLTLIGSSVFYHCTQLTGITIPEGLTLISDSTFLGCSNLTDITLPKSLTQISDWAFLDCPALSSVLYAGTERQWGYIIIGDFGNDDLLNANIHYNS